jgi:hypothetical protein
MEKENLLELELSIRREINFLVLKVSELNSDEKAVLTLGPLNFREQTEML